MQINKDAALPSLAQGAGSRWSALKRRLRDVIDALWGYDFFISYAWNDGQRYPEKLKVALERPISGRGFSVFLDSQDGFRPGDDLRLMTRRRVRSSTHLVIVGREHALMHSRWVPQEAENYIEAQVQRETGLAPIIIDIDGTLERAPGAENDASCLASRSDLDSWLRIEESLNHGEESPSADTIKKLVNCHQGVRREAVRARFFAGLAVVFFIVAVVAILLGVAAWVARSNSQSNLADAQLNLAESWRREGRLNQATVYAAESLATKDSDAARRHLLENPPAVLLRVITLPDDTVSALALSKDGLLAVGSRDGRLQLFNLAEKGEIPLFDQHLRKSPIYKIVLSKTDDKLAVAQEDGVVWFSSTHGKPSGTPIYEQKDEVGQDDIVLNYPIFLADGRLALVADKNGSKVLQLFDSNGKDVGPPFDVSMPSYGVSDVASHPSKPKIAVLYSGGALATVDLSAPKPVKTFVRKSFPVGETLGGSLAGFSLAFDPAPARALDTSERDRFAVGMDDASVWLVDANGEISKRIAFPRPEERSPRDAVLDVWFTLNGDRLLALRDNGELAIFRRDKEWQLERILAAYPDGTGDLQMACCAEDYIMVTAGSGADRGSVVKVWDISATNRRWVIPIAGKYANRDANISALAFDQSGRKIAAGTNYGDIAVLDLMERAVVAVELADNSANYITSLAFGRGEYADSIFASGWNRPLHRFSLTNCSITELIQRSDSSLNIYGLDWNPLASALIMVQFSDDWMSQFKVAQPGSASILASSKEFKDLVESVISFTNRTAAIGFVLNEQFFYYWGTGILSPKKIFIDDKEKITALAVTPDGSLILAATNDRIFRWRLDENGPSSLPALPCDRTAGLGCGAWRLAIDPRGRWFATSDDRDISIRRIADGLFLGRLSAHSGQIDALAASNSGDFLASGGMDGQVIVWDLSPLFDDTESVRDSAQASAGYRVAKAGLQEVIETPTQASSLVEALQRRDKLEASIRNAVQHHEFGQGPKETCAVLPR